jgi:hypothetical protein
MASSPAFAPTPRIGSAAISAANTNRDGSGTVVTVITGVAAGTKINEIDIQATVTTTAGMVRLFLYDGSNYRPLMEVPVSAVTVSASVSAFSASRFFDHLVLPSASWSIVASTHNAEAFTVTALGADL